MRFRTTTITIAVAAVLLAGCGERQLPPDEATASELPSEIADVGRGMDDGPGTDGSETGQKLGVLETTGEFASPEISNVAIKNPGRVSRVDADRGDRVRKGQPLLHLETEYLELDMKRAAAEVARSQAALDEATRELDRKEQLRSKDSVPQATLDRARSGFDQARAGLSVAEALMATVEQRLADTVLRAPFDGVVMERRTASGERLSERQDIAFVLARTTPLHLQFDVSERHISAVKEGQVVKATTDSFPGEIFEGRVSVVGQTIDSATRTFFVEAEFANDDGRLKPGLFARVQLELD